MSRGSPVCLITTRVAMSRDSLHADLIAQRDDLLALCDSLTDGQLAVVPADEQWGIKDIVGHLSFWEQHTLKHIRDTFKYGRPSPAPEAPVDDDMNARAVAQRRGWTWRRVRTEFENTRNGLIVRVEGLSDAEMQFYVPSPWSDDRRIFTMEEMIREDVLEHCKEHIDKGFRRVKKVDHAQK